MVSEDKGEVSHCVSHAVSKLCIIQTHGKSYLFCSKTKQIKTLQISPIAKKANISWNDTCLINPFDPKEFPTDE